MSTLPPSASKEEAVASAKPLPYESALEIIETEVCPSSIKT